MNQLSSTDVIWVDPRIKFDMASRSVPLQSDSDSNAKLFTYTEPNAYITNTLNKLIFTHNSARFPIFVMRTQLVFIFWSKMVGRAGRYVLLLLQEHKIYLMCINHFCMRCSVLENNECSGFENRQFSGVLRVIFEETDGRNKLDKEL